MAGQIVDTRRQLEEQLSQHQADLFHIDAVLKLYGVDPEDIPTKGRVPVRSPYFGRKEISTRCRDMLRPIPAGAKVKAAMKANSFKVSAFPTNT